MDKTVAVQNNCGVFEVLHIANTHCYGCARRLWAWAHWTVSLPAELQLSLRQLLEGALVALTPQLVSNEAPVAPGIAASLSQPSDKAVCVISSILRIPFS